MEPTPHAKAAARLEELAQLEDGWLDGDAGTRINEQTLNQARAFVAELTAEELERFAIFPTELGGISFEDFSAGPAGRFVDVEIEPSGTFTAFTMPENRDEGSLYIEGLPLEDAVRFAQHPNLSQSVSTTLYLAVVDGDSVQVLDSHRQQVARLDQAGDDVTAWARDMLNTYFAAAAAHPTVRDVLPKNTEG